MNPFENYAITSPYGMRRDPFNGLQAMHTGIDLTKFDKAPIYAFMAGEVVHAKLAVKGSGLGDFGIVVALVDLYGGIQFYAHLDSVSVRVGQQVKRGQEIGRQGNTGHSKGSHLHFETRLSSGPSFGFGTNTDPTAYLQKYLEEEAQLEDVLERLKALEEKTKVLDRTEVPDWFTNEFGNDELDLLKDTKGDLDFWRSLALSIRLIQKKK